MACPNCSCGRAEAEAMAKQAVKESERDLYLEVAAMSSCENTPSTSDDFVGCGAGCACANMRRG